ncbi:MAG: N-acetyltransferase [Herbinix sp.]|jgi:predicted GNAT family acetyltransferase|nr:N-acetyltransferase [Herbinix sp.]
MSFNQESNKIYLNDDNNHMIAVVTFPKLKEGVVNIDHTFVDPSLRGQGVAGKLMEAAVAYFRANELKVKPTCSYAVKWFSEHPECDDLIEKNL